MPDSTRHTSLDTLKSGEENASHYTYISEVQLHDGILDLRGVTFLHSQPLTKHKQRAVTLKLDSNEHAFEFRLGSYMAKELLTQLSLDPLNYSHSGITTPYNTGIPLVSLPAGNYKVSILNAQGLHKTSIYNFPTVEHNRLNICGGKLVRSYTTGQSWRIDISEVINDLETTKFVSARLHQDTSKSSLVLHSRHKAIFLELEQADVSISLTKIDDQTKLRGEPRSALATRQKHRNTHLVRCLEKFGFQRAEWEVDLEKVPPGTYEVIISFHDVRRTRSYLLEKLLRVTGQWRTNRMPRIAVLGSCVTRDNFSSQVVPDWRNDFELVAEFFQMSIVSLMSPPVPYDKRDFPELGSHHSKATERDFDKSFLADMRRTAPDFLLVDVFADARWGVIGYRNTWITRNLWKIGRTAVFKTLENNATASFQLDRKKYLEMFTDACKSLQDFLQEYSPSTRVILVSARNAYKFHGLKGAGRFPNEADKDLDPIREQLEAIFLDIMRCPSINAMNEKVQASSDHPWGKGKIHYNNF